MPGIGQSLGMTAVFPYNLPGHKIYWQNQHKIARHSSLLEFYFEIMVLFLYCVYYSTAHMYVSESTASNNAEFLNVLNPVLCYFIIIMLDESQNRKVK